MIPSGRTGLLAAAALAVWPAASRAQTPAAPVAVDVVVSARSGAVPALDTGAFGLTVNGAARTVTAAGPAIAPGTGRTIYLAIDQTSVFKGAEASLRGAASNLADRLAPGDRLGIVRLPDGKASLAPTDDAAKIEAALAEVEGKRPNDFANFSMGVGEALAISESDTFALTGVADRHCAPPEAMRPAEGSPVVPATRTANNPRRACVQTIVRNVEVMMQRVNATGVEAYRGLVDFVASVREVPGPKTVILITAGFAIALDAGVFDELATRSTRSDVAVDAVLVEPVAAPNSRRLVAASPVAERRSLMRRLNELTASALGGAVSVVGSATAPYDRLMTSSARYRLEVAPTADGASDIGAKVAVTVAGAGLTVRARPYLVPPAAVKAAPTTPEARLGKALGGTAPTGNVLAIDAGGYLAGVPGETATLLIAGEVQVDAVPEGAPAITIGYLLLDGKKQPVVKGPVPPIEPPAVPAGAATPAVTRIGFAGSVDGLPPDVYTLRVAATDGTGRVGLVERELILKAVKGGDVTAGDILIGRVESDRSVALAPGAVAPGDSLFLQWDLAGVRGAAPTATLKIVDRASGAVVMPLAADVDAGAPGTARVSALVKPGLLPVGDFDVVGEITAGGKTLGERRHGFTVRGAAAAPGTTAGGATLTGLVGDISGLVPRFTRDAVLAPAVLDGALAALDGQAKSDAGRAALARARRGDRAGAAGSLTGAEPVIAAFFRGLSDLEAANLAAADAPSRAIARGDLERAAQGFREALRADPDFLPAAIYLGACYALGGRDREAAGAWQTALIALDSRADVFRLTVDAHLRTGDWPGADELLSEATQKFPGDRSLVERKVMVELALGRVAAGLAALDGLEQPPADLLYAAMRILHGAHAAGIAVEDPTHDRARFSRYFTTYTARQGPDRALAERWLEAMK